TPRKQSTILLNCDGCTLFGDLFIILLCILSFFSPAGKNTLRTTESSAAKALLLTSQEEDLEYRKLSPFTTHKERLETCQLLISCSPLAQVTSRDRQGTRHEKIPQHMRRLLVY
ncbi:mCG1049825, partial [Mus musculus]